MYAKEKFSCILMNILGITHDVINTSASLIINGKIVAAIAEERLTRQKNKIIPNKCY